MARSLSIESVGDRYQLERELGRGPVGAVFAGVDLESDQPVCVKLLESRHTQDPRFAVRFREGQRQIAPVAHENLARVIDYGCQDGRYYIVTEWLEAEDLGSYLAAHAPLPHPEAVAIGRQICAALAAAHQGGVLHRGLKPQNVLIAGEGGVTVADLGLAGVVGETGLSKTKVLASGVGYMAPEQASGQEYGPESDIYSVGVLLYEMLTGRRPFDGRNSWSLLRRQVEEIPRQPSQLNPEVPFDLGAVVMIALRKDRAARYARAEELAEALQGNGLRHEQAVAASERRAAVGPGERLTAWLTMAAWKVGWAVQAGLRAVRIGGRRLRQGIPLGVLVALLFLLGFGITFGALSTLVDGGGAVRPTAIQSPVDEDRASVASAGLPEPTPAPSSTPTQPAAARPAMLGQEREIEGIVQSISSGAWTVAGTQVHVNAETEIEDQIYVGDYVRVEGQALSDGSVLAEEIEREGSGDKVKFRGQVQAISGQTWTVAGRQVIVGSETKVKGSIQVGDTVNVNARQLGNGTLVAEEIELHR